MPSSKLTLSFSRNKQYVTTLSIHFYSFVGDVESLVDGYMCTAFRPSVMRAAVQLSLRTSIAGWLTRLTASRKDL